MSILAKSDLTFQNFTFNPVAENGQVWITSTELAKVLEYKKTDAISQIYARNSDEFTDAMTMTLNLRVIGINNSFRNKSVRVYSLRGCHLIAMFATTPVAKEFRRWVLDILDREVQQGNAAPLFASRVMLYIDEHGATIGSMPLREDEVVMSFDSLNALARRSDWIIERRVDLTRKIEEAIQNLH